MNDTFFIFAVCQKCINDKIISSSSIVRFISKGKKQRKKRKDYKNSFIEKSVILTTPIR